jgi:FlaA1/EpsC-like NDP-sugar epimerase
MIKLPFKNEEFQVSSKFYTYLDKLINTVSNEQKYTILTGVDIILFAISIGAASGFESGFELMPTDIWNQLNFVVLEIAIKIGIFWAFNIYQQVLRHANGEFLFAIAKAVLASCLTIATIDRFLLMSAIPASVLLSE